MSRWTLHSYEFIKTRNAPAEGKYAEYYSTLLIQVRWYPSPELLYREHFFGFIIYLFYNCSVFISIHEKIRCISVKRDKNKGNTIN